MRCAGIWSLALASSMLWPPGACAQGVSAPTPAPAPAPIVVTQVDGAIGPATADHLRRVLALAAGQQAQLVVLQLDTPGGLDAAMRSIIKDILASPVPVASFVAPSGARAASAGTYIVSASHVAAMVPASNLGAATPVEIGLGGGLRQPPESPAPRASDAGSGAAPSEHGGDAMAAKRVSDASAYIRSLAQLRGRNVEWAEKAVRDAHSLSAQEALAGKVVDLVANDVPDLLRQLDGREIVTATGSVRLATHGAAIVELAPDWRSRLLSVVADPSLALILMLLGIYGLLFEFSHPGFVLPGVVGGISLLLALFALQMLPVNYAGLGLIFLGIAFLVAEAFVPSGVLGIGGVISLAAGAVLLIDSQTPGFGVPLALVGVLTATTTVFVLTVAGMAARARRRPLASGASTLLGVAGELLEVSGGEGWAVLQGERWRVHGAGELSAGARVRVVGVRGLILDVAAEAGGPTQGD